MVGESENDFEVNFQSFLFQKNFQGHIFGGHLGVNNQILEKKDFWIRTFK